MKIKKFNKRKYYKLSRNNNKDWVGGIWKYIKPYSQFEDTCGYFKYVSGQAPDWYKKQTEVSLSYIYFDEIKYCKKCKGEKTCDE